jgi:hypothetical protein
MERFLHRLYEGWLFDAGHRLHAGGDGLPPAVKEEGFRAKIGRAGKIAMPHDNLWRAR